MTCCVARSSRRSRDGYATVVVLIVIGLLTAVTALNIEVAVRLHRHILRLDQRHQQRWLAPEVVPAVQSPVRP